MKYADLLQFEPVADAVRLADAALPEAAGRLVSTWRRPPALAAGLAREVLPVLRAGRTDGPTLLFVIYNADEVPDPETAALVSFVIRSIQFLENAN